MKESVFGKERDCFFMQQALKQAQKAFEKDEVPVGAVVVDGHGRIITRGHNVVEKHYCQLGHAECIVLAKAGKKIQNWRLHGCWLYVTLEPCSMCMGLVKLSRLAGIVYGTTSPFFGYRLDKGGTIQVYQLDARTPAVISGVCAEESAVLIKRFFKNKRKKGE